MVGFFGKTSKEKHSASYTSKSLTYVEFIENVCACCNLCIKNNRVVTKHFCFKKYSVSPITFITETFPLIKNRIIWPAQPKEARLLFKNCFCNKCCDKYDSCNKTNDEVAKCEKVFKDQIFNRYILSRKKKRNKKRIKVKGPAKNKANSPSFIFGGSKEWRAMCKNENSNK